MEEIGQEATMLSLGLLERCLVVVVEPNVAPLNKERPEGAINKRMINLKNSEHVECCFKYISFFH